MSSKTNAPTTPATHPQALRIGSRVRCTDDGVAGRIVWANGVSVKVRWDDGEQVTWRRGSLADRPIEVLDPEQVGDEEQAVPAEGAVATAAAEPATDAHPTFTAAVPDPAPAETPGDAAAARKPAPDAMPAGPAAAGTATTQTDSALASPGGTTTGGAANDAPSEVTTPEAEPAPAGPGQDGTTAVGKRKKEAKAKCAGKPPDGAKKLSALDAAAKVLGEAGVAMTCTEMIDAMAAKGYWTSPAGKTPSATLYSALLRELQTKGANSRFVKVQRGKFTLNTAR